MIIKSLYQLLNPPEREGYFGFSSSRHAISEMVQHSEELKHLATSLPNTSFTVRTIDDEQLYIYCLLISKMIEYSNGDIELLYWSGLSLSTWFYDVRYEMVRRDLW